jgi:hypothetical protein
LGQARSGVAFRALGRKVRTERGAQKKKNFSFFFKRFESDDLWVVLKNGIVLIRVINTLKPGTIPKYNKTRLVALLEMDNIQLYLKACWQLGLPSQFIFSSSDLHKRSDMRAVARNIEALSKLAPSFGIASPAPLDSSKKGPPPKVALVEESGGAPEPVDFAEKVVQLRDTINKTKQQIEAFEAEEEQLRTNIREERSNWQKEKMQLVYQLSAAEKRVKSVVSSSSASGAAAAAVAPSPSVSRIQEYKSSELDDLKNKTKTEERLWQTAKERKKQLADEEEALLRDIEKLKQALKRPAAPIVTPVVEEEEEDKRGSRLVAASNSNCFFLQTEVTTPENVAHLTQRLEALMRDKTVEFEDLFSLKRLLETDEGRRVFCFVLFAQIRARKQRKTKKEEEKMVLLSVQNFDLVLWLFNTVVQSLSRQDVKTDYFATRVILKSGGKELVLFVLLTGLTGIRLALFVVLRAILDSIRFVNTFDQIPCGAMSYFGKNCCLDLSTSNSNSCLVPRRKRRRSWQSSCR